MLTINKQDIGNLLLLDYLSSLHTVREKLRLLETKYHSSREVFVHASHEENMQQWDDYIEWKAYLR